MTKRLTDSEIWEKDWYLDLSIKQKLLVKFLFDNCDCAGVYQISYRNLKTCFGEEITKEDFAGIKQIRFISEDKIFIEDFIDFHYLSADKPYLNPNNKVHLGVIRRLIKNNIDYAKYTNPFQRVSKPFPKGTEVEVEVEVGVEVGVEKEGVQGGGKTSKANEASESETMGEEYLSVRELSGEPLVTLKVPGQNNFKMPQKSVNPDVYFTNHNTYFSTYAELCPNLIPLSFEKRNGKVLALLEEFRREIDDDVGKFEEICRKANKLRVIATNKIDFQMVIRNYLGILNGKYKDSSKTAPDNADEMSPESFFKGL